MSDDLPPLTAADAAVFAELESHDRVSLTVGDTGRAELKRHGGQVTATMWSAKPELEGHSITIEGAFPSYQAAMIAFAESAEEAAHHALAGLPRH